MPGSSRRAEEPIAGHASPAIGAVAYAAAVPDLLLLKLVLTPALIAGASLAGRRWGHAVSGWLVGLPLTSGPVAFFLALERGESFAAAAALGALAGAIAEAAFCLAYAWTAKRGWLPSLIAATVAFAIAAAALQWWALSLTAVGCAAAASLVLALRLLPRAPVRIAPSPPPAWDLPARTVIATVVVLAITEGAPILGPRLSGILATFPVYAAILAVFAHRADTASAVQVLRGLLTGLFAFAAFFVILALVLERFGVALAFIAASVGALAIQSISLTAVIRSRRLGAGRYTGDAVRLLVVATLAAFWCTSPALAQSDPRVPALVRDLKSRNHEKATSAATSRRAKRCPRCSTS